MHTHTHKGTVEPYFDKEVKEQMVGSTQPNKYRHTSHRSAHFQRFPQIKCLFLLGKLMKITALLKETVRKCVLFFTFL